MSTHINAKDGDIAQKVLLPGDPLRAKHIAQTYLEDAICYNEVRGMYGYTGTYKGKKVSVQGTGMGMPSLSIYVTELIKFYGAKNLIRVGTCGALQSYLKLRDVVIALGASTDSNMNNGRFGSINFAATADFELLYKAYRLSKEKGLNTVVGNIFTSDKFYDDSLQPKSKLVSQYGTLAVDMETCELYTLAAKYHVKAVTLLTVSDSLVTNEKTSAEERESSFNEMVEIALNII